MTSHAPTTRRTKIVCTLGPATKSIERIHALIDAGMDVARLNFSHGTHADHETMIQNIRRAADERAKPIAIVQDLQGPKIRVGKFENGSAELQNDASFIITARHVMGNERCVSTTFPNLPRDLQAGNTLLLDDGYITLIVEKIDRDDIITRVVNGGTLRDSKGIVAPGIALSTSALSEKDVADVKFGLKCGVDCVALSFVQSERDVIALRDVMKAEGRIVPIIAKIERYEGIADIEDIIDEADAIMVARGDLGIEMNAEDVPILQKRIIERCNYHGKPVITATQMLESMIEHPRPTRAEASDVANAVFDGTDAVMLSGETSVGAFPIEAVQYMDRIVRRAEQSGMARTTAREIPAEPQANVADAIGKACCVLAEQIRATAIVPLTTSGMTARVIAKYRPSIPIIALTDREQTQRELQLVWGVTPMLTAQISDTDATLTEARAFLKTSCGLHSGDTVVFTAGIPLRFRTSTNMLQVVQLT